MSATGNSFDTLLLIGRPAAGKSEILEYLRNTPSKERLERFHIGELEVIDDFPMLWAWFEEDRILRELGHPQLHTTRDGYFKEKHLWDLLIRRLCLEYRKRIAADPDYRNRFTTVIEFSRGSEHGGYARAFRHLSDQVLEGAALVYVNVSYQESLRKNRQRFNPDRPDSILEHALPDEKMERLYRDDDWPELSAADPEWIRIGAHTLPYAVFENEDDVTTAMGAALGRRLEKVLSRLWEAWAK